jgi:hypothetical protein
MRTHHFGRKINVPATVAIKQIRMGLAQHELKRKDPEATAGALRAKARGEFLVK